MFHCQLHELELSTATRSSQVELRYSALPPRKEKASFDNLTENLAILWRHLKYNKKTGQNLKIKTSGKGRTCFHISEDMQKRRLIQGAACGLSACTHNDWTTIMADFILLNFMYKSLFQIKHFNVKTMVHLNN